MAQNYDKKKGITPRHEKLWVWQKAHKLMIEIHEICKTLPPNEKYVLRGQIERSSKSVADNIAEGNSSYYYNDKIKGFYTARKESGETQNHLREMEDKHYLSDFQAQSMIDEYEEIIRGLNGLITRIAEKRDQSNRKGAKRI